MTKAEWLACDDPAPMLDSLRGKASQRKLRLFACACVRRVEHLLETYLSRQALEVAERYADGSADDHQRRKARQVMNYRGGGEAHWQAFQACERCVSDAHGAEIAGEVSRLTAAHPDWGEQRHQCDLLRDIFGPAPFRRLPRLNPAWLAWEGGTVPKLAASIYDERAFDRLPILADALEEAGCDAAELLTHLRWPGPHVRGCWALDLVLGKG
jgi:hypothetical protein